MISFLGMFEVVLIFVTGEFHEDNKISQVTATCIAACLHYVTQSFNTDFTRNCMVIHFTLLII